MLEIKLIGTFDIKYDGKPVIISSRAAQSLFAYLILSAGTLHRREKLAGIFWPDTTEEKARAYLRHEIWRIRKALPPKSKVNYLFADDINISFNSSAEYGLDITTLENSSVHTTVEELMNVLSDFHGELLPGFYEDWIVLEREHLQAVYEQKIAWLLELLESEKRWTETIEWAERWISFGQGPEAAYRYLMIAYDALGDRAKVAATYERCVRGLAELGFEPSEETRTLAATRKSSLNIPIPMTSFIGRESEIKEVAALLSKSRLVTLTGSGGVGKTRLAIQAVAEVLGQSPDGVWFLDLAPLSDPRLVPTTLANLLGLRESGELSVSDLLVNYFHFRTTLVIFDNCEHLIESCAQLVNSLLTSCENLSILATSREALRVSGEIPYRVPSLEVPSLNIESAIGALTKIESVRLFTERAAVASPGFTIGTQNALAIAQICQRLDGIPLAIELAAARANILTVEQIAKRLDHRFNLLKGGLRTALPRHQTLLATIEWSYSLLLEQQRLLFRRLAVFMGGWTLEAAEEVCSGNDIASSDVLDLLSQLVNKSLVVVEIARSGETRYRRLETIRQYAREKLEENGEAGQVRSRHLDYFLKLAQKAEPELYGAGQIEWSQKLMDEHENLRAALEWSLQENVTSGQQLAGSLWWYLRDNFNEGYEWLKKMLDAGPQDESIIRAKLLSGAGFLADNFEDIKELSEKSVSMFRKLGDEAGAAFPLLTLGSVYGYSDFGLATQLLTESLGLFKRTGNKWGVVQVLGYWGYITQVHGNFEQASQIFDEALLTANEIGNEEMVASLLFGMGALAKQQTHDARAMELFEQALGFAKAARSNPWTARILRDMGVVSIRQGDYERGILWVEEMREICRKLGNRGGIAESLRQLGWAARLQEDYAKARSLYAESLSLLPSYVGEESYMAEFLIDISKLLGAQGHPEKFASVLGMAEGAAPEIHKLMSPFFRAETEKFIENARAALGDEAYNAAWEAGRQMSLDEAVTYALKELQ